MAVQHGEQYVIALGAHRPPRQLHADAILCALSGSDPCRRVRHPDRYRERDRVEPQRRPSPATSVANTLDGRGGSDIIDGGFGNDIIIGNGGTDTASFLSHDGLAADGSPDVISLGNGTSDGSYIRFQALGPIRQAVETDVLRGIENVTGSDNDEVINGNDGINVLDGRAGNDVLDGGLGDDTIIGGDGGIDTASYLSHDGVGGLSPDIRLGLAGADGSYVRLDHGAFERDILRGIENVTGSNQGSKSSATSATTCSTAAAAMT